MIVEIRGAQRRTAQLQHHRWFRWTARAGLAGRGVIYAMLGIFSVDIAWRGSSPEPASGAGAVAEVARQPAGPALVAVLVSGLAAYATWRVIDALSGREKPGERRNFWVRIGWLTISAIYAALCVRAISLLSSGAGATSSGANSQRARAWAASVLGWPAGPELLGAVGVGMFIGAVALVAWGFAHAYEKELRLDRLASPVRLVPKILGSAGDLAWGFLLGLVALYLLEAAVDGRSANVKTVDLSLRALAHEGYGAILIFVLAVGLFCFALYSFGEAWLRDL